MKNKLIKNYVDQLTLENIDMFAKNKNILLTKSELNYIYNVIKQDWETIIFNNPINIFNALKQNINTNSYNKILSLYNEYKEKYQSFL